MGNDCNGTSTNMICQFNDTTKLSFYIGGYNTYDSSRLENIQISSLQTNE